MGKGGWLENYLISKYMSLKGDGCQKWNLRRKLRAVHI